MNIEYAALAGRTATNRDEGWTPISGSTIDLIGRICAKLEHLRQRPNTQAARSADTSDAVRLLAHESQHAAGEGDEAITECYALQRVAETAHDLGMTTTDGSALAQIAWARYPDEPARYRTSKCRNGGPLDLRPNDPHWP